MRLYPIRLFVGIAVCTVLFLLYRSFAVNEGVMWTGGIAILFVTAIWTLGFLFGPDEDEIFYAREIKKSLWLTLIAELGPGMLPTVDFNYSYKEVSAQREAIEKAASAEKKLRK